MPVQKYHHVFVQSSKVLRLCGGNLGIPSNAVTNQLTTEGNTNPTGAEILVMMKCMEQEDIAVMFINGADSKQYNILKQELLNDCSKGHINYPTTLAKAQMMLAMRQDKATYLGTRQHESNNTNTGSDVAFTRDGQTWPQGGGRCYCCGSHEHLAPACPNRH